MWPESRHGENSRHSPNQNDRAGNPQLLKSCWTLRNRTVLQKSLLRKCQTRAPGTHAHGITHQEPFLLRQQSATSVAFPLPFFKRSQILEVHENYIKKYGANPFGICCLPQTSTWDGRTAAWPVPLHWQWWLAPCNLELPPLQNPLVTPNDYG